MRIQRTWRSMSSTGDRPTAAVRVRARGFTLRVATHDERIKVDLVLWCDPIDGPAPTGTLTRHDVVGKAVFTPIPIVTGDAGKVAEDAGIAGEVADRLIADVHRVWPAAVAMYVRMVGP